MRCQPFIRLTGPSFVSIGCMQHGAAEIVLPLPTALRRSCAWEPSGSCNGVCRMKLVAI